MDRWEDALKQYLEEKRVAALGDRAGEGVPEADEFYRFVMGQMDESAEKRMLHFIGRNRWAQDLVLEARTRLEEPTGQGPVPPGFIRDARGLLDAPRPPRCPHCGKPVTPFKRPVRVQVWRNAGWLAGAVLFFALSFALPRYFMQCLLAAALCGFKGIVEHRAAKTQILIYKALSEPGPDEHHRLHGHSSHL